MEEALSQTAEGRNRLQQSEDRATIVLSRHLEIQDRDNNKRRKTKHFKQQQQQSNAAASSSSSNGRASKRPVEGEGEFASKAPRVGDPDAAVPDDEGDVQMGALQRNNKNTHCVALYYNTVEQHHKACIYAVQRELVTEVYSPPRVAQFTNKHNLIPGPSIYIQCADEDGTPWDLSNSSKRNKLIQLVADTKSAIVVGSPMCTMFSSLQNLNKNKDTPEHQQKLKEAISHIEFCITLYTIQIKSNRYFLHEHPRNATSWTLPAMTRFINKYKPYLVNANTCAFGMTASDQDGTALFRNRPHS
jgi:hypothetical protein